MRSSPRFVLLAAALLPILATGCGRSSPRSEIDVPALERQLETVVHYEKLAQGFDFEVSVSCAPSAELRYECHVDAATANRPTQSWSELVTCRTPPDTGLPRCTTDTGDALQ
jgi:hypothetical protein